VSCLSRPGGCAQAALVPAWPLTVRGAALAAAVGAPPAAFAGWPFFSAAAVVTLPAPPAANELLTLTCEAAPAPLAVSVGAGAPTLLPCGAPAASTAVCAVVPQGAAAAALSVPLVVALPGGGALPTVTDAAGALLTCELRSVFSGVTGAVARLLPRYGEITTLSLPLVVLPAQQPLLAALVAESRAVAGTFRVISGVGAGTVLPLLLPPARAAGNGTSYGATASNSSSAAGALPSSWDSRALAALPGAAFLAPLLELLAPYSAAPAVAEATPAQLSTTLSSSAHLLLLFGGSAPPFDAATLNVSLNGFPCGVNWVAPSGAVASVTTPPLATLCGTQTSDCGTAVMVVRRGGRDPLEDVLAALVGAGRPSRRSGGDAPPPALLLLPAAYPPLPLPAPPTAPELVGLSLPDLLAYARAATPAGAGIRLAEACTDPAYAPAENCALVGGRAPPPPPNGTVCAYGAGAACAPCPSFALCPGGATLLLRPGFWAPLPSSPPDDVVACPPPAAERCKGWELTAGAAAAAAWAADYLCGPGYTGAACSGCARGFFPAQGACLACPSLSSQWAFLIPPLQFLGGLAAAGVLLFIAARRALAQQRGGKPPPFFGEGGSVSSVMALLLWAWGAAQTLSALFSQAVADGSVPRALVGVFAGFSALQFQGVTLAPACNPGGDRFASLWSAAAAAYGVVAVGGLCILALLAGRRAAAAASAPPLLLRATHSLLGLCATFFLVGFGALVGNAVNALACTAPTPLSVAAYAATSGDGAALSAAFGSAMGRALPNMTVLCVCTVLTQTNRKTITAPTPSQSTPIPFFKQTHGFERRHLRAARGALSAAVLHCVRFSSSVGPQYSVRRGRARAGAAGGAGASRLARGWTPRACPRRPHFFGEAKGAAARRCVAAAVG
jgi:hypothetical protein